MSRSRHVGLEQAETAMHGGRQRRASLEEQLAEALAHGDRERVSLLREELDAVAGSRPMPRTAEDAGPC